VKQFSKILAFGVFIPATLLVFGSISLSAAEFTAKFIDRQGDQITEGDLYVKGTDYCMIMEKGGSKAKIIVDTENNKTIIAIYSEKEYHIVASDDMISLINDPFQSYNYSKGFGEEEFVGTEMMNGYECDVYKIAMGESPVMTKWHAKSLNFPIKIVGHGQEERIIQLNQIEEEVPNEVIFAIPEGFTKWVDPESLPGERPEWADQIAPAPVMNPPFEKQMQAGEIVRVKIERGKSLAVKATEKDGENIIGRVIPFKADNPLRKETRYNNFAQRGVICERRHEMNGEADEFIIRLYEGNANISAKWVDMFEKTISAGEEIRYPIKGPENITARFINLNDGLSEAIFSYYKNGQPMEDNAPAKYKTITLENPWDVNRAARTAKGDDLVIKVTKGKMQIKLGQFDSFEF